MATVNQIYSMVNDAASEALGKSAITAKDTGTLVSLGDQVFSSDTNKEQFYKAITFIISCILSMILITILHYLNILLNGYTSEKEV